MPVKRPRVQQQGSSSQGCAAWACQCLVVNALVMRPDPLGPVRLHGHDLVGIE